ncbi:taste receptor type 2 member 10-like [Myxocyprinus asiaticus]|uniref:taste receptor type 2 member 10-like n=1 Tax=Myxocyprinus asiaticus TaxID=70543 RepID=UPI002223C85E|nr:taste receptor type 2 member 10-like [Myxocyprinus asiaticus]
MGSYLINMSLFAFAILNVPISGAAIMMNMFYVYCMFSPQNGSENILKPPLNVLLGSLIGCNLTLNFLNLLFVSYDTFFSVSSWIYAVSSAVVLYVTRTSFTTSLGLNVFYYFQIVPVRQAFLVWVKTHMKVFMYLTLVFDRIFFLFEFILQVMDPRKYAISEMDLNSSIAHVNVTSGNAVHFNLLRVDFWLRSGYLFLCVVIMLASNTVTVLYLCSHMKSMKENTSSSSRLHHQKQMRVTVMGIIQMVLFFISSGWLMTNELFIYYFVYKFDEKEYVIASVMTLYSLGTTMILGVGQTTFRLRAIYFGKILLQSLKFLYRCCWRG